MSDEVTVVFGNWLIFDGFPGLEDAERFASWVADEHDRKSKCVDADTAGRETLYPFELASPVVLVARDQNWTGEPALEESARVFGGRFAGT